MALFFLVLLVSLAKTAFAVNCDNDFMDFDHTKIQSSGQSTWISETWPNKVPTEGLKFFTTNNFYQASIPYAISGSFGSSDRNVIEAAFREVASTSCVGFGNRISPARIKLNMFFSRFVSRSWQSSYIYVKNDESGCWAYVGYGAGRRDINLASGCVVI